MTFHGSIPNIVRAQIYDSYVEGTLQLNRVATPYIDDLRSHGDDTLSGYTWQLKGTHGRWMLEFDTDEDAVDTFLHALESTHNGVRVRRQRPQFHGHVFFDRMMASRQDQVARTRTITGNLPSDFDALLVDVSAGYVEQSAI